MKKDSREVRRVCKGIVVVEVDVLSLLLVCLHVFVLVLTCSFWCWCVLPFHPVPFFTLQSVQSITYISSSTKIQKLPQISLFSF